MKSKDRELVGLLFETIRESLVADIIDSKRLVLDAAPGTCIPVVEVINIINRRLRVYEEPLKGGERK